MAAPAAAEGREAALYTLRSRLVLTNDSSQTTYYARVEVPLPLASTGYNRIQHEDYTLQPKEIVQNDDGTRLAVFMLRGVRPGQSVELTLTYQMEGTGAAPTYHGSGASPVVDVAPQVAQEARRLVEGLDEEASRAAAIAAFTHGHITFNPSSPWRNSDPLTVLERGEGVCEDFASSFSALARACGIEARVAYGYRWSPESRTWQRHAWAEFRSAAGVWKPVDPTFAPGLDLDPGAVYLLQWYQDLPVRVAYAGGRIRVVIDESMSDG